MEIKQRDKSIFLEIFGDSPKNKILDFLVVFDEFDYSLTDIAKYAGVSYSTIQLIWDDLEKTGIVKQSRIVGKAKMYKINKDNPVVKEFIKFYWGAIKAATKLKIDIKQKIYA
ncbi:winged helix-turn-helix transcriptional regulator [Candidatus Woesearchaeota archaeon]|nr:winged helix-turn-helix transcriptional regulator [Candidatus Woesearchaeota archaeon]